MSSGPELPRGTVTFLFTDIEGSTKLLKQLREQYAEVLSEHQRILRDAFAEHGGREIDTQGDSFFVAFGRAKDAIGAAMDSQRALSAHGWPEGAEPRVRMGVHTGEPVLGGDRYVGLGVHRAARISAAGHGGQVLVSQTTRELLRDDPIPEVTLRDLGEHQLKDLDEPERIFQLVAPGLAESFPPLTTAAPAPFEGREVELATAAQDAVGSLIRPWWSRRRLELLAVAAASLLVLVLGVVLVQGGGGSAHASGEVAANNVGVVDVESGEILSEISVDDAPSGIAYGDGSVWVANSDAHSASRIDTNTNSVRQTIQVGGGPSGVVVSGGAVWVSNGLDGTVSRIDPSTNQVVQTIAVGNGPTGIAADKTAVWVANSTDGTVSKIDADSGLVVRTFPTTIGATGVAVGFGRLWVVSPSAAGVVVLDPGSGVILDRIGVGVEASAVAIGADAVWVANRGDGTVSKIDPPRTVVATIPVGRSPRAIAVDPDGVWVANSEDGTLSRIDPATDSVSKTVRVANPPHGLAVTANGVYVAVQSTGEEHRGGTLRVSDLPPVSIDPARAAPPIDWSILSITNDGLVAFRRVGGIEGAQIVPDLAVSVPTPTDEGRTYTFRLRRDIVYSTGKPVQPSDFRRAIERIFEARPASYGADLYAGILGTKQCKLGKRCDLSRGIVTDGPARTVTYHLAEPDADFLTKLALPGAAAVPTRTLGHDIGTHPLPATGPYQIASYRPNLSLKLIRNARFRAWSSDAKPDGYPDAISWSFYSLTGVAKQIRVVEHGAADVAVEVVPPLSKEDLDRLATKYPQQLHLNTSAATIFFSLNTRVPPFDDVRVRRAVNYAFDRPAFAQLLGRAFGPTCQILPANFPGHTHSCPYLPGGVASLDRARKLVRSSGTTGSSVTVWVPGPIAIQGRFMVSVLQSLGFRARLNAVPIGNDIFGAYFSPLLDSRRRVQTGYYGWNADFPSAVRFLQDLFSCRAFVPRSPSATTDPSEFCVPSFDRQMKRAAAVQAQDPAAATVLWQKVERAILERAPMVPAYNRLNADFVSERVGNYRYHPQWGVLLDQLWVK